MFIRNAGERRRLVTRGLAGYILALLSVVPAAAVTETTLIHFGAYSGSFPTGANPSGTLLRDANGALYGTNTLGGSSYSGTVYRLNPPTAWQNQWTFTLLYTFTGGSDDGRPNSNLVMDSSGALYGTAASGGSCGSCHSSAPRSSPASPTWTRSAR